MNPVVEGESSGRARRALPLIAAALALAVIAGVLYLRTSSSHPPASAQHGLQPFQIGGFLPYYDFVSPSLGWAVVEEQEPIFWIFKTSDGAQRWERQYTGVGTPGPVRMQFFDADHGIVAVLSADSLMLRTDDGGLHWRSVRLPAATIWVAFANAEDGWAVAAPNSERGQLFATGDSGISWVEKSWPAGAGIFSRQSWFDVHFRGTGEGWIGASIGKPAVFMTMDGGDTWQSREVQTGDPPKPGRYVTEVNLLPGSGVISFVLDDSGIQRAFASFDQGATWRPVKSPPAPASLADIAYSDSSHWWAMKSGSLFKSANAGQSWTRMHVSQTWDLQPAGFIDARHAWSERIFAQGRGFPITGLVMTSDGGASWKMLNVPSLNYSL